MYKCVPMIDGMVSNTSKHVCILRPNKIKHIQTIVSNTPDNGIKQISVIKTKHPDNGIRQWYQTNHINLSDKEHPDNGVKHQQTSGGRGWILRRP